MTKILRHTGELRFIKRTAAGWSANILQQGWINEASGQVEWIDVPCVEDEPIDPLKREE